MRKLLHSIYGRVGFSLIIGLLFGFVVSEGSYLLQRMPGERTEMRQIELVIPAGTADRVAAGEETPSIPGEMTFVVGDILVVRNDDSVSHQLGPVWVPPQSKGVLTMDTAQDYAVECSFRATRYLGLEVRQRLTIGVRVQGILAVGLPTAAIIVVYSLALVPQRKDEQ